MRLSGEGAATRYAELLLQHCGGDDCRAEATPALHPDISWARSGAMALTGEADGPPRLAPGPFAHCMTEALVALRTLSPDSSALAAIDAAALLGEKAALAGLTRNGPVSPGGSCRLLRTRNGWLALNLAREDDREMLPAWLEAEPDTDEDPWCFAQRSLVGRRREPLIERARMIGLAAAASDPASVPAAPWLLRTRLSPAVASRPPGPLRVLDLSALWAGPLCAQLLAECGADVIKLESTRRPDGGRAGDKTFFDVLNGEKQSCAVDLQRPDGVRILRALIDCVDIVVESARPRALKQLGIDAEACIAARPGLTWLAITGHGRDLPFGDWIAFGDDAGVAAGLSAALSGESTAPVFCGDAIADPLTGAHAAAAALACHLAGGGELLDVSLRAVAAHALAHDAVAGACNEAVVSAATADDEHWQVTLPGERQSVLSPRARRPVAAAHALGADTEAVLRAFGIGP